MAGHSKWSQIKRQKALTDIKKSQIFSKIARIITLAARKGEKPEMNPDLRVAIEKAKVVNMPLDNIERAIKKGDGKLDGSQMENMRFEAYGPGGVAIIIEGVTDNKNRTVAEIKHIFSKNNLSFGQTGSAVWAFEYKNNKWESKNKIELNENDAQALDKLLEELDDHDDVQEIYTNAE